MLPCLFCWNRCGLEELNQWHISVIANNLHCSIPVVAINRQQACVSGNTPDGKNDPSAALRRIPDDGPIGHQRYGAILASP